MNRISRDASGSYEYYHADGLGSTRQITSDAQAITQTTTYDAFGNIESSAGSSNNVYRYAGQWGYRNDGDDGLMHVGARDYDPLVGRFLTADTWLGEARRPQSLHRYNYCEGDPVNHVDPTGRGKIPPWVWVAGPVAGIAIGYMLYEAYELWKLYKIQKQVMERRERDWKKRPSGTTIHPTPNWLDSELSPK